MTTTSHIDTVTHPGTSHIDTAHGGTTYIYTDGSCLGNPGPGGWAAVIVTPQGEERRLSGAEAATTNNRMELRAAIEGLRALLPGVTPGAAAGGATGGATVPGVAVGGGTGAAPLPGAVRVISDSEYVKKGITEWIGPWKRKGWVTAAKTPVKNRDLWQQLDALNAALHPAWDWVKGHAGHAYNELCDALAREAAGSSQMSS
jgi:ribonuclease HI